MIISTHTDNLIRLYRMNGDNALVQVGQLEATQPLDPVVLATMVGDLTVALAWEQTVTVKVLPPVDKPVKATKATPKAKPKPRISKAEADDRRTKILTHLRTDGPLTAPAMARLMFPGWRLDKADSCARGVLDDLVRQGKAIRQPRTAPGVAAPYAWVHD